MNYTIFHYMFILQGSRLHNCYLAKETLRLIFIFFEVKMEFHYILGLASIVLDSNFNQALLVLLKQRLDYPTATQLEQNKPWA